MKKFLLSIITVLAGPGLLFAQSSIGTKYGPQAERIITRALRDSAAYERLAELCDTFGPRLSGTKSLENALDWCIAELKKDGFTDVHGEKVLVPHWIRGAESCVMISPREANIAMLGLGGSIATPKEGITAEVLVVRSFNELREKASQAKGKIVLYNVPFTNYGATVQYRGRGASEAARYGAVASLVRSVGPASIYSPHTGAMYYNDSLPKIPAAAISLEDAEMMARMQKRGQKVTLRLSMEARFLPDAESRNVVAEIPGSEKPGEVVVFGGHIDSWDVGQGAMDDAGGCVAAWQALKIIRELGLKPKRTIRLVLWTNEENGLRGGQGYAKQHGRERHVLALESDGGVFRPQGFYFESKDSALTKKFRDIASLLRPIGAGEIFPGGGGADISPLIEYGAPQMELKTAGERYFWYHHSHGDTVDKLDPDEMNRCIAAMAVMAFVAADAD